jgi:hypothetical protein
MTMLQQAVQLQSPDSAGSRFDSEGLFMPSEEMRQFTDRDVPLDLNLAGICPVCGKFYQPGDSVVALASPSVRASAVAFAAADDDQDHKIILGHHDCVVPRLMTLLVRSHLEDRFAGAEADASVGDSVFPEGHYGTA